HGVHQGQDLAPGWEATDASTKAEGRVAQVLETELGDQGSDEQQAGIGHEIRVIEGHRDPVDSARYWLHRKCLLGVGETVTSNITIFPSGEAFSADTRAVNQLSRRWIQVKSPSANTPPLPVGVAAAPSPSAHAP